MGKIFRMSVSVTPKNFVAKWEKGATVYVEGVALCFRHATLQFLAILIMFSRVKTGRMKAAWTPMMTAYGFDYGKYWVPKEGEEADQIEYGKSEGSYQYNPSADPFSILVINSVKYSGFVEDKYGSTERGKIPTLVPYFEKGFDYNVQQLNKIAEREGVINGKSHESEISNFEMGGMA